MLEIKNCYDSHTHFLATGETTLGLSLRFLKSAQEVSLIEPKPAYFKDDWLVGFGWNQYNWSDQRLPHRKDLDQFFPNKPVFFSRVDGHCSWLNSLAITRLQDLGFNFDVDPVGGAIERDQNGPTGILFDQAHINALLKLPSFTVEQTKSFALASMQIFNRAGFTHARDLSMTSALWKVLCEIQQSGQQTICIDGFITAEAVSDLERAFIEHQVCQSQPNPYARIHGLKIFVDGSLGSKTAYLSQNYLGTETRGLLIWKASDIEAAIEFCWKKNIDIAIHTIGDEALHIVALAARKVSASGLEGRLHLEHAQIMRPETVNLLKPLHVSIYMQPSHYLSDHQWLGDVLSKDLQKILFPWQRIRKNKIPLFFGSDSPIEPTGLLRTLQALNESEKNKTLKIPRLEESWISFHAHPDSHWTQSKTVFDQEKIREVIFDGKKII